MVDKVFNDDPIVLFTSCDDNYVPYLLVLLTLIIGRSLDKYNYDIYSKSQKV